MSGTKKLDNAYVNFPVGENSSKQIPTTNTVFHVGKTYYCHPIYTNYGCSTDGHIINRNRLIPRKGRLHLTGYLQTTVRNQNGIKNFYVHRFVYECFNGNIPDKMQINHIDSNKQNNFINNLELVTHLENMKHALEARKYKTKIEIKTEKPIKSIKMDIEMGESDDEFTEDEKQKIDKKCNTLINKINNGIFPYKRQLQEHLPGMNFW